MAQSGKHLANAAPSDDADEPPFDLPEAVPATLPKAAEIALPKAGAPSGAESDDRPFDLVYFLDAEESRGRAVVGSEEVFLETLQRKGVTFLQ